MYTIPYSHHAWHTGILDALLIQTRAFINYLAIFSSTPDRGIPKLQVPVLTKHIACRDLRDYAGLKLGTM